MNSIRELSFWLRNSFFGKVRLRRNLPAALTLASQESRFFRLILGRSAQTYPELLEPYHLIDIGCGSGASLPALIESLPQFQSISLIEADGGRRYLNLYRRRDQIQAQVESAQAHFPQSKIQYKIADFTKLSPPPDLCEPQASLLAFCSYPFVFTDPCRSWGLPDRFANWNEQVKTLQDWRRSLNLKKLLLLSVHQGIDEKEESLRQLQEIAQVRGTFIVPPDEWREYWPSPYEAHVILSEIT